MITFLQQGCLIIVAQLLTFRKTSLITTLQFEKSNRQQTKGTKQMSIIETINSGDQFANAFNNSSRAGDFSYQALTTLFDFYDELEGDVEFDPIAFSCEWTEYDTDQLEEAYSNIAEEIGAEDFDDLLSEIEDRTIVLHVKAGVYLVAEF